MTIPGYICELLYRYDCVIVPDFGAFLTKRVSAQLIDNVFYPPHKKISFNQQVISNDGLLANYISSSESISYDKALEKVQDFVLKIKNEIMIRARLSLNEIGSFTLNHEQKLVFEPLHSNNYLTESFGLSTFTTTSVTREVKPVREELKKEVEQIEEKAPIVFTPEKRNKFKPYKVAAAAAVAAILLTGVGSLLYKKSVERQNSLEMVEGTQLVKEEIQNASFVLDILKPLPSISVDISEKENTDEVFSDKKYHIVAGAFREFANMKKKQSQLSEKGFEATYIGENKYGLHQVVYNSFSSREDALEVLRSIKRNESRDAWLLVTE